MIDRAALEMQMGASVSSERISGVNDNMTQCHYHDFYELYYLEDGERYHVAGDRITKIKAGEFILFPPYVLHRSFGEKDVIFKRIVLYFSRTAIPSTLDERLESDGVVVFSPTGSVSNSLRTMICRLRDEEDVPDKYSGIMKESELREFLISILRSGMERKRPAYEDRITKILSYLNNNYGKEITLQELGDVANVSIYHLSREFKRYTNTTIVEYLTKIRILHAERMFLETDNNMTEIAYATGFTNLNHFSRTFKQVTGETPTTMKKRLRNKNGHVADTRTDFKQYLT